MAAGERFDERVAIVTGAAQGIGAPYACALAREGAAVVLADVVDAAPVATNISNAGGRALALRIDVTSAQSAREMAEATVDAFNRIDILVNNAGLFANLALRPFEQIESEEWDRVMSVNVRGAFECSKAIVPAMRAQGYGKIINIASRAIKREALSEDLCGTLIYLASAASDFVTGQVVVIDGGSVMH